MKRNVYQIWYQVNFSCSSIFGNILWVRELEQVHKCYMCLLFGCMADDFWLCKVQNEVGTFRWLSLSECKHWNEKIILKLHKFARETWSFINILSSSYVSVVLALVKRYSFSSSTAHGYQAMNGKYQQPNYYVQSQSQTKHTG